MALVKLITDVTPITSVYKIEELHLHIVSCHIALFMTQSNWYHVIKPATRIFTSPILITGMLICIVGKKLTNNFAEKTAEKRRAKFDAYLKVMSKIIYPTGWKYTQNLI